MKAVAQCLVIEVLASVYLLALLAVVHPKVSRAYRSYFIDRTSSDWNPAYYPGTPEQGMSFSRKGLPEWADTTSGLSAREDRGRWTDSDVGGIPGISFTRKFNGSLCLEFTATPAPSLIGKTIAVQIGNQTKTLQVVSQDLAEYQVQFTEAGGADRLSFLLPEKLPRESEVDHRSGDMRRLGLQLSTLRILPGSCDGVQVQSLARHLQDAEKVLLIHRARVLRKQHARHGSSAKPHVQLFVARSAGAEGSSAAGHPDDGRRSSAGTVAAV